MWRHFSGCAAMLVLCCGALPAIAATPTLKRVMLSSGGVGYFEYEAPVEGDATVTLDVPLDQVDDVLKSLVVYDSVGGVGEVTLPGREPLAQSFADLPFDPAVLNSAADLLNALQGSEIRVVGPRTLAGRLVHVDQETVSGPGGVAETRARVSVMTPAGLQQAVLQDVEAIAFADPELQRQVNTALARIAAYRLSGQRRLSVHVHGGAARTVRLGYVVAMPLWKASYRLSLPADAEAAQGHTARLQGWAVLENFSGRPWQDVELTLLSGNPVTFRQALYESYYVKRPTVPVESGDRILPPPDTGAVAMAAEPRAKEEAAPPQRRAFQAAGPRQGGEAAIAAPAGPAPPPPPSQIASIEAAQVSEQPTQVAFTPPYKVTVAAGQSLMLPLLDRELPTRRIDLYQPAVNANHPLAAVEMTNDSGSGLPPGALTLYRRNPDGSALYLGDARLAAFPAGDKRLLSYALDGKVTIDRSTAERRPIVKASVADGVVRIGRVLRWTTTYRVKAAGPPPPALSIEQPRRTGAVLTSPDPKTVELTPHAYRIPAELPAGGDGSLTVVEEQPIEETIRLLDADDRRLGALASAAELDPKMKQALAEVAARRQQVGRQKGELDRLQAERARLLEDENRLRANLSAVGNEPALRRTQLDRFTDTENAIDRVSASIATASDALVAAARDLAAYVNSLTL
ncbi:MAG: hypothetical protein AB7T18_06205 [Alphaproteobacteria bacterium]